MIAPIPEEDEGIEEDPNPLLMHPPLLDAVSLTSYHTTTSHSKPKDDLTKVREEEEEEECGGCVSPF